MATANYRGIAKNELITLIDEFPERSIPQAISAIISFIGKENVYRLYDMTDEEFYSIIEKVINFEKGE